MSLNAHIQKQVEEAADTVAIEYAGVSLTFSDLARRIDNIATFLSSAGNVRFGDRVAYLGLNHPDMVALLLVCEKLGAVFVPFNNRLARQELNYLLADAEPVLCIYDNHFSETVGQLNCGPWKFIPRNALDDVPACDVLPDAKHAPGDALLLVYTSGTTGRPKGVVLSRSAVAATVENGQTLYLFSRGDRVQITLPLFHVGGLCILLLPALLHGASIHLHERFNPQETLREISRYSIMTSIFVPAQMSAMMQSELWDKSDLSSLKYVVVGSSIIPHWQIERFHARDIPVSQIYGATETGPSAIGLPVEKAVAKAGSAGIPLKHCEIEIRGPDGQMMATAERGEVWVKGANILTHYWRNPQETGKVLTDGWYNTGDIGYRDADGYFWIVDRAKDMIISGGENIYPAEIETASLDHPAIAAIAVVGKHHPRWGETPVAVVEITPEQQLTLADYHDFLEHRIARYKLPQSLKIVDTLPRNAMGKVEKSVLRELVRD